METGSELLLKADGQFEWHISYGAFDQTAKGRWGRSGQTVMRLDVEGKNLIPQDLPRGRYSRN